MRRASARRLRLVFERSRPRRRAQVLKATQGSAWSARQGAVLQVHTGLQIMDDPLHRERPWNPAAADRLLLDIGLALFARHAGSIDEIELDLVGYYTLGFRDLNEIAVLARLAGRSIGTVSRRQLGEEAEQLFAAHDPGARFLRDHMRGQLIVARDRISAHQRLAALRRLGLG